MLVPTVARMSGLWGIQTRVGLQLTEDTLKRGRGLTCTEDLDESVVGRGV